MLIPCPCCRQVLAQKQLCGTTMSSTPRKRRWSFRSSPIRRSPAPTARSRCGYKIFANTTRRGIARKCSTHLAASNEDKEQRLWGERQRVTTAKPDSRGEDVFSGEEALCGEEIFEQLCGEVRSRVAPDRYPSRFGRFVTCRCGRPCKRRRTTATILKASSRPVLARWKDQFGIIVTAQTLRSFSGTRTTNEGAGGDLRGGPGGGHSRDSRRS